MGMHAAYYGALSLKIFAIYQFFGKSTNVVGEPSHVWHLHVARARCRWNGYVGDAMIDDHHPIISIVCRIDITNEMNS